MGVFWWPFTVHVGCACGRYRHDSICKHSIAVAARQSIFSTHFNFLKKKSNKGGRTALAEHDVNRNTAGKKGSRNKNSHRPERESSSARTAGTSNEANPQQTFTKIHHNENQFHLMFLPNEAKICKTCEIEFCKRKQVIPFNMVFAHKERWLYPTDGAWSKTKVSSVAIALKQKYQKRSPCASITPQENASCRGFPTSVGVMLKSRPLSLIRLPNHTRNISKASFKMLHYN